MMIKIASAVLLLSVLLAGCTAAPTGGSGPGSDSVPGSGSGPVLETIRIGVMSDVGAVPFMAAQDQGFFEDRGLDVEITVFKSAMDRDTALQTGNLEGAMTDMLSVILFKKAGFEVRMTSDTYGNYKMVTSPALDLAAFEQLKSVSIGISSNTVIDLATSKIAQEKGFSDRLKKIAIPQMPVRLEMLGAGELDGATLPEPLASAAMQNGGYLVASTEQMDLFPAVFAMTQTALEGNPRETRLMYEAYNEAVAYLNSVGTAEIYDFLVDKLSFPANLKGSFNLPKFTAIKAPDEPSFAIVSIWAKDMGLSDALYNYSDLTDSSFLP